MPQPYNVFIIYAREDSLYLSELLGQLRPLEIGGRIKVWCDREINPGVEWEKEIVQRMDTADIILLLVSSAYYNSVYIHEVEIKYALSRHERGEAKVLPVIVRPVTFGDDPIISRLQVLPTDGRPVTDRKHWPERDDAWLDVVAGVKKTLDVLRQVEKQREKAALDADASQAQRKAAEQQEKEDQARRAAAARLEQKRHEEEVALTAERKKTTEAAHQAAAQAWNQATDTGTIAAYQQYLAGYPQGEYAREARYRMKQLKQQETPPIPYLRFAAFGGGGLLVLLVIWMTFGRGGSNPEKNDSKDYLKSADTTAPAHYSTPREPINQPSADSSQISHKIEPKKKVEILPGTVPEKKPVSDFNSPMVRVEGGTFTMGCTSEQGDDCYDSEKPAHQVTVGSFYIGKYEVTQAEWRKVMGNNPSTFTNCDQCPVENVSWDDIQAFIKKLNAQTGLAYRLPTEAEWEYAARGGSKSRGYKYSGSNNIEDVAFYSSNSRAKTHPVGGKKANELGLFDMSGNVWEWCSDWYGSYTSSSMTSPIGPGSGSSRVYRGGSWGNDPRGVRVSFRVNGTPSRRDAYLGFRLARTR